MGFDQMKLGGLGKLGMIVVDGATQIPGQPAGIGSLLDQPDLFRLAQGLMELGRLSGQQFSQNRSGGNGSQKVAFPARPGLAGGVKPLVRMVEGLFHENMEGQGALRADLLGQEIGQAGAQRYGDLIGRRGSGARLTRLLPNLAFKK